MTKVKDCKKVDTGDKGWLLEIVSEREDDVKGQVYLTTVKPGAFKGYHLHTGTDYYTTCIKGMVKHIVFDPEGNRTETVMGDGSFKTVYMPQGSAHALENIGEEEAYVIMYRSVAYDPEIKEQIDIEPENIEEWFI